VIKTGSSAFVVGWLAGTAFRYLYNIFKITYRVSWLVSWEVQDAYRWRYI